jgi:hypothetical protein
MVRIIIKGGVWKVSVALLCSLMTTFLRELEHGGRGPQGCHRKVWQEPMVSRVLVRHPPLRVLLTPRH